MKLVLTTAVLGLAAIAFASAAIAKPSAGSAAKPVPVAVTGTEFSFKASKKLLPRNRTIVFRLRNVGDEVHDLAFSNPKKKTAFIAPGKTGTVRITFKKKGRYQAICTVGEHFIRGMKITFTVK
jgi:uncharacterized cupredoxin-like copper-binding protein